ncbi:MAG: DUF805 domain-containing protein [Methyloceanibacter sp.]
MNFDAQQFYFSAEGRPNRQQWWLRLIPSILVDIKRWRDRDKSGWWMPILFVPIIGAIWLFLAGTPGPNRFGGPVMD